MGAKASCHQDLTASKNFMDEHVWKSSGVAWSSRKCSVRAYHQLEIKKKPGYCDFCRIVSGKWVKTKYYTCKACNLDFCFSSSQNYFKIWHSEKCDHYRGYT